MKYIDARHTKPLTRAEERALTERVRQGDKRALNRLMLSHYRFAAQVCHRFTNAGIDMEDLMGVAILGLHTAALRFDPGKNLRFMSYAVWWIRQALHSAIRDHSLTIRLPAHYFVKPKIKNSETLSIHEDHQEAIRLVRNSVSVDVCIDSGHDFMHPGDPVDRGAEVQSARRTAEYFLSTLDPLEAKILRARFGMDTGNEATLEEVGLDLKVTKERVRQRQNKALATLRHRFRRWSPSKT